jgi:restriction system protein
MKKQKSLSLSRQTITKTLYEALQVLKDNDGSLAGSEVMVQIKQRVGLTSWEKERYEKTGYVRWESILHFHSIGAVKAGYLVKKKGVWYLTDEGEKATKLSPTELLDAIDKAYKKWEKQKASLESTQEAIENEDTEGGRIHRVEANIDQLEEKALKEFEDFLKTKNPYELQDMVAGLLEAMGYFVSFVSPKGKDGGLDIVVYADPLGAKEPRIKVQVKHKPDSGVPVSDIRALLGLLNKSGDVGLFVTSGRFSSEAKRFARDSHKHVDLIDSQRFLSLWQEYYTKMNDETKNMMPLRAIYFLGN